MPRELMYIELKTGYSDDDPAWISYVMTSKTGKTIGFQESRREKATATGQAKRKL